MLRSSLPVAALAATLLVAGCSEDTPTTTIPDAPVQLTEAVTGTVTVNGASTNPFSVNRAGSVTVQLTALAPDDSVTVGLALGTWNGAACQLVIANDAATLATVVLGTATASGTLCVRVSDVGQLSAPTDYEVRVTHY